MKKILTIAVACAGLMSFTACNNFLDEEPRSELTDVAYYQTQAQMESNVNYLYRTGAINSFVDFGSAYTGPFMSIQEELTGYFSNSYEGWMVFGIIVIAVLMWQMVSSLTLALSPWTKRQPTR